MFNIRAKPSPLILIWPTINLIILIAIIGFGIYMFKNIIRATKDIGKIKDDMERIIELLNRKN